ncbi:ABC transporter ATP-binding protein [bacterium]|nr:ABC transporter ATP-binding protein [bacterium]
MEPTGVAVRMCSSTRAERMMRARSSRNPVRRCRRTMPTSFLGTQQELTANSSLEGSAPLGQRRRICAMSNSFAIQTRALSKHYGRAGEIKALNAVDLEIKKGELFGFLGPNGAGKSTAIRTLLGFLHPTSGSASVLGLDIVKDSVEIRRRVGYLPSGFAVYDYMSGREYLDHMRSLSGRPSLLRHRRCCGSHRLL